MKAGKPLPQPDQEQETFYAAAQRSKPRVLRQEARKAGSNPVIDGLVASVGGLLAVLNDKRQILAVNDALLAMVGLEEAKELLGLRPGQVFGCVHADELPHGCGTTAFCSTCGAAVAMVLSQELDMPVEERCAMTVQAGERVTDLVLSVRSCPITLEGQRLLILFLQDITHQQNRAALERIFFHDLSNLMQGLVGTSELLASHPGERTEERLQKLRRLSYHLAREVAAQKGLAEGDPGSFPPSTQSVRIPQVFGELREAFVNHPVAQDKRLALPGDLPDLVLVTDSTLLLRVLVHMTRNALEATPPGGEARVWLEQGNGTISFCAWNREVILPEVARRIFQRNFTTKKELGRGLGTYSMKLFAERFLGGQVAFTSREPDGTVFQVSLPV